MARSIWKGPFVEESVIKKVDKQKNDPNKKPIKIWSRKSTIIPDFVGISFLIYNGKNLFLLQFQRIWLDINLVNSHQQDNFLVIHQQIKKLKKVQTNLRRKNNLIMKKDKKSEKIVKSINKNVRSSTRKLKPILRSIVGKKVDVAVRDLIIF